MYIWHHFNINEDKKRYELIAGSLVVKKMSFKKAERKGSRLGISGEEYARGHFAGLI